MTDWRAVGYGFIVMLIAGLLATFAPIVGHIGAGLIRGSSPATSPAAGCSRGRGTACSRDR